MSAGKSEKARRVFVIHGRERELVEQVYAFIRSIALEPLEWSHARRLTGKPTPYTWEIVEAALENSAAIVALLTPDDEARLKGHLVSEHDDQSERELTGQPRQNVLFEAGVAFGKAPNQTVLASVGQLRPISDLAGHHILKLSKEARDRNEFAQRLKAAGCDVDLSGQSWLTAGDFELTIPNGRHEPEERSGQNVQLAPTATLELRLLFNGTLDLELDADRVKTLGGYINGDPIEDLLSEREPNAANWQWSQKKTIKLQLLNVGSAVAHGITARIEFPPTIMVHPFKSPWSGVEVELKPVKGWGQTLTVRVAKLKHKIDPVELPLTIVVKKHDELNVAEWSIHADNAPDLIRGKFQVRLVRGSQL